MHPNPAFRQTPRDTNIAFARARGFGVLTLAGPDGPLAAHVPFVLNEEATRWEAHLVRSNPIWRAIESPQPAMVIVSGPDGYISPDWYGLPDQVPTWNYIAVHLRGTLRRLEPEALEPHARRLAHRFEQDLLPKTPWTEDKMDPDALARMRRMIVPVEMTVESVEGTWKLGQNKPDAARLAAAAGLEAAGLGFETARLAAHMRDIPTPD